MRNLRAIGVHIVVHAILGLPFETKEQMLETVRYIGTCGAHGIKLQLLHVLRGTDLEPLYESGTFRTLESDEYIDLLCECLERLPPQIVIHRLTGDAPKKLLIAPLWSANKKQVLNTLHNRFEQNNIIQGKRAAE